MADVKTEDAPKTDQTKPEDRPDFQAYPKMIRLANGSLLTVKNQADEDQARKADEEAAQAAKK